METEIERCEARRRRVCGGRRRTIGVGHRATLFPLFRSEKVIGYAFCVKPGAGVEPAYRWGRRRVGGRTPGVK